VLDRTSGALAVDTVTIPYENPWNALFFTSGHDFFSNGDAAVAAIHGDVWRVSGLDEKLGKVTWKRFATGLYQPLGLKIIGEKVHVLERDQITILHDLNNDGEADYYENFNNDCISGGGGHSYATCLETDSTGNFYFLKCSEGTPHGGTLLKVARDGSSLEVVATGFRNPNGLGIGPGDFMTVADQQGEWVPETRLDHIRKGGFYGYMPMHKRSVAPTAYDPPLCWIPRNIDNSAGGQVWIPEGSWGALSGQMLHLSFGRCTMMLVLRDPNGAQGGIVPLPGRFASGVCRGRFNAKDGHLYVSGLRGWQTAAVRDGCFQRVRYRKPLPLPVGFATGTNVVTVTFAEKLDRELAEDIESYSAERWNYRWSSKYGSPDFSLEMPEKQGRDKVRIAAAKLGSDGKSLVLTIPDMRLAMQLAITYNLETESGEPAQSVLYLTVNKLAP
jgi:sugar lactone lactonase YvrE